MTTLTQPEPWLRGPVDGFEPLLMPVVHAFIQAREDVGHLVARVPAEHTWERPGGAPSIGFHVRHLGGALDRLFTYARGEALSDTQKAAMRAESDLVDPAPSLADVAAGMNASIERALEQLRTTTRDDLLRRCCTNRDWPARCPPTGSSPADAIRHWSAEGGHPIQDLTAENGLTPLPSWTPGAKAIADDRLVAEERILHPALTMVP